MALKSLQNSTETPPVIKKDDLTPNKVEIIGDEPVEEIMASLSAKKNAALRKRKIGLEEEEDDKNTMENPEKSILIDKDDLKTILYHKSEFNEVNDLADENMARRDGEETTGKKNRRVMIPSDDEEDDSALMKFGEFRTEMEKKVRRKLALDEYNHKRDQKKKKRLSDAAESSPEESRVSSLHESGERSGESDLDDFVTVVDQDSKSQDLLSSSSGKSSGDESDLDGFVVKDSQSQDLTEASSFFYNPSKEELFERFVETILNGIMDEEFSSSLQDLEDYRFRKAQTYYENLINTKKDRVVSNKWIDYKKMLMECPVLKSKSLGSKIEQKCEGCLLPRTLSECMVFYKERYGRKIKEFKVGCYCAGRGFVFHELHHFKQELEESCSEKVDEVRDRARTETPKEIVHKCIEDKEWLDSLFRNLQLKLNAADSCQLGG